ncbi:hypothetical protein DL770_003097 [Monosporascus sp. CRB-9-2]|nr:hypothetical protein DL770_003097 [Monosporascus sp. CRB-9-2]
MLLSHPQCRCGEIWDQRYPLHISERVLRDTIAGSRTLHTAGIAYGDLHLSNVLFTLWGMEHLIQLNEVLKPLTAAAQDPVETGVLLQRAGRGATRVVPSRERVVREFGARRRAVLGAWG